MSFLPALLSETIRGHFVNLMYQCGRENEGGQRGSTRSCGVLQTVPIFGSSGPLSGEAVSLEGPSLSGALI